MHAAHQMETALIPMASTSKHETTARDTVKQMALRRTLRIDELPPYAGHKVQTRVEAWAYRQCGAEPVLRLEALMNLSTNAQAHVEAFDEPPLEREPVIFFAVTAAEVLALAAGQLPEAVQERARCARDWDVRLLQNARKRETAPAAASTKPRRRMRS